MPNKKLIKKIAKPAKKAVQPKKSGNVIKKNLPAKKSSSKPAVKSNQKALIKTKVAPKLVVKKSIKIAASKKTVNKSAVLKPIVKPLVTKTGHAPEKHNQHMAKNKRHEEKHIKANSKPAPKKNEPAKEVRLPKITAKNSVPYQPSYKSMEQRQEVIKPNEPLIRYNDTDLNEFRELIQKKLNSAKKELAYLQGLITRKDDMGGDESENRYMTMEDGSISMEREQLSQMASRQITYIDHLEKALIRIENKTYGICRVTGKLIDKARLRAVPHATLSLEAKLGLVRTGE